MFNFTYPWLILAVLSAISLNGNCYSQETGCNNAPTSFGERQLDQMLDDRPDMKGVLPEKSPVLLAIIAAFNGERLGQRIYWVDTVPREGRPASHNKSRSGRLAHIMISSSPKLTPVDKWAYVIFELYNIEGDFNAVLKSAYLGSIEKEAFVEKCINLE